ncbi:MAG TPA: dienelactone hydrolase family protein [Polyangiaceae bacterium]|nr:dienelactone hydrolase family protein [Polyangiaceae bacterium]
MKKTQLAPLVLVLNACASSASTAAIPPSAPAPAEPAAPPPVSMAPVASEAPTTPAIPDNAAPDPSLQHHAMLQEQLGFYAVVTPPGYDAPENKNKRYPVVVLLHGDGSDEVRESKLAGDLGRDGVIYVLPRAPYPHSSAADHSDVTASTSESKAAGWSAWPGYPHEWGDYQSATFPTEEIKKLQIPNLYTDWIAETIKDARKRYRASAERVVVVGEGQGAAFAHLFAARHPLMVKAYYAHGGYYDEAIDGRLGRGYASALKDNKIKILLTHNEGDPVIKAEQTKKLDQFLTERKVEHTVHVMPGNSHEMSAEEKDLAHSFVRQWCCGEKPAGAPAALPGPVTPAPATSATTNPAGAAGPSAAAAPAAATPALPSPAPLAPAPGGAPAPIGAPPTLQPPSAPAVNANLTAGVNTPPKAATPAAPVTGKPAAIAPLAVAPVPAAASPVAAKSKDVKAPSVPASAATPEKTTVTAATKAGDKPHDVPAMAVVPPKSPAPALKVQSAESSVKTAPVTANTQKTAPAESSGTQKSAPDNGTTKKEAPTTQSGGVKTAPAGGSTKKEAPKEAGPKTAAASDPTPVKAAKPDAAKTAPKEPSVTPVPASSAP